MLSVDRSADPLVSEIMVEKPLRVKSESRFTTSDLNRFGMTLIDWFSSSSGEAVSSFAKHPAHTRR